jgi:hypothetical protein
MHSGGVLWVALDRVEVLCATLGMEFEMVVDKSLLTLFVV